MNRLDQRGFLLWGHGEHNLTKRLISKIYKKLKKLTTKEK
jgi:hypothetical protein